MIIINKTTLYTLFAGFVAIMSLGLFANIAGAQYYSSYYSSTTTYPYQYNYGSYQNSFPSYSNYDQTCPGGYTVTTQGVLIVCNNNTSAIPYSSNPTYGSVLGASTALVPGCMYGYIYSTLTGKRCDSYDSGNFSNNTNLSGTRASIEDFEVRDGDDTNIEEGDDDAELVEVRFKVEDGDIRLDRAEFDFEFNGNSNGEDQPWETFDEIRLLSDGHEIDSVNADDRDEWDKEDSDTYSITFTNLDEIIRENDRAELTIEVDVNSNISGNGFTSWNISVPDRGIRAQDGNGRTIYGGEDDDEVSIDIK